MKEQLLKAMKHKQIVNMMYMSKSGEITKRKVKLVKIAGDSFQAYCFTRRAKRTFTINNVLVVVQSYTRSVRWYD